MSEAPAPAPHTPRTEYLTIFEVSKPLLCYDSFHDHLRPSVVVVICSASTVPLFDGTSVGFVGAELFLLVFSPPLSADELSASVGAGLSVVSVGLAGSSLVAPVVTVIG